MVASWVKRAAVAAAAAVAVPAVVVGVVVQQGIAVRVPDAVTLADLARGAWVVTSLALTGLLVWVAWGLYDVQRAQAELHARQRVARGRGSTGDGSPVGRALSVQYMPVVNVLDWTFDYRDPDRLVGEGYDRNEAALLASLDVVEVTLSNTGNGMATGLTVGCRLEVVDAAGTVHDIAEAGVEVRSAPLTRAERFELHSFASEGESLGPGEEHQTFAGPLYAVREGEDGPEVRTVAGVLEDVAGSGRAESVRATFVLEYADVVGNGYRLEATPVEASIDGGPRLGDVVERAGGGLKWQQVRSPQLSDGDRATAPNAN